MIVARADQDRETSEAQQEEGDLQQEGDPEGCEDGMKGGPPQL